MCVFVVTEVECGMGSRSRAVVEVHQDQLVASFSLARPTSRVYNRLVLFDAAVGIDVRSGW